MSQTSPHPPKLALVARWTGRILSLGTVGLLGVFMVGEGFNPLHFAPRDLVLSLFFPIGLIAGLLLGWRWELAGGLVAVGSVLAFYLLHFLFGGSFPKGWVFPVLALPGFFFLIAAGSRPPRLPPKPAPPLRKNPGDPHAHDPHPSLPAPPVFPLPRPQ